MIFLFDDKKTKPMQSRFKDCQCWDHAQAVADLNQRVVVGEFQKYVVEETGESVWLH